MCPCLPPGAYLGVLCSQLPSATRLFYERLGSLVLRWGSAEECKAALLTWERQPSEELREGLISMSTSLHGLQKVRGPMCIPGCLCSEPLCGPALHNLCVFTQPHNTSILALGDAGVFGHAPCLEAGGMQMQTE